MPKFDWNKSVSYDDDAKKEFHRLAKRQLKKLAEQLGFSKSDYDLRSNMAGPAVSGEVTLHHEDLYIQASQSVSGKGILIRTCEGRKDYTGGKNHFANLEKLEDKNLPELTKFCEEVRKQKIGFNADLVEDKGYNPHYSTPRTLG